MAVEKRYQVFISSTYEDLPEERQEVMQALLELDCIPAGMELFPAANDDQWTLIKRVIDDCDYYIVIIGGRYGSVGPAGISYTQMEYEYAVQQGKPVIAFLHKDPSSLPANRTERDPVKMTKLEEFRSLAQRKMCKYWTSPADLGSVVSRSLIKLTRDYPAVGWVRGDLIPEKSAAEEILMLRKQVELLKTELGEALTTSPQGTEKLAQGDDGIVLNFTYGAYSSGHSFRADHTFDATLSVTWNEIFSRISPLLIDEASDTTLKTEIDRFISERASFTPEVEQVAINYSALKNFSLNNVDFNTIKVQLLALGLMTKSNKKKSRSVTDRSAYWMLTPYGEKIMMSLRAIKRTISSD